MRLSERVRTLEPSITLTLSARAKELAAAGEPVIDMAVGEPDFPAPARAREAAVRKVESGDVRYTPAGGTPELRAAIATHLGRTRGGIWSPAEVTVCHSTKHALSGALLALVQAGDEVILPLPAWSSYGELVRVAGARPVPVEAAAGCRPDLERIAAAVGPRTRAILYSSPCNPSGVVWTARETERLAELAVEHDLVLLSDEIYHALVYGGDPPRSPASVSAEARARTVVLDGASKAYAMTGYRIGFLAAPAALAAAVAKLHGQTTGSPNAVSQAAYLACLGEDPPELARMRARFAERRDVLLAGLADLGLETPEPRGAFYAFPDVARYLDERGSAGFCEDLLEETRLALVPGSAFGMDRHVRLSYAVDVAVVREALERLGGFLAGRPELAARAARS